MEIKSFRIGVTTRIVQASGYNESRDAIAHDWANYLKSTLPHSTWMPLPNLGASDIITYCNHWEINALILTGGDDIGQTPLRDETEFALLNWAAKEKLPLLGVCRGMQLLGKHGGASLIPISNHASGRHNVHGDISGNTNSFHNYSLDQTPKNYRILAKSDDGHIEAIKHHFLPWIGCMWHPEREMTPQSSDLQIMRELFT